MPKAFCGLETVRKIAQWTLCALWEIKLTSVRDKTPQRVVYVLYHTVGAFYSSQKNTDEQNTQSFTETLSQPISQNVTATFSYNVLWYLYAEGLLWARNCAQKAPWTLCALWEKNLPSELFMCCIIQWERSISHRFTQMNRTHKGPQRH